MAKRNVLDALASPALMMIVTHGLTHRNCGFAISPPPLSYSIQSCLVPLVNLAMLVSLLTLVTLVVVNLATLVSLVILVSLLILVCVVTLVTSKSCQSGLPGGSSHPGQSGQWSP